MAQKIQTIEYKLTSKEAKDAIARAIEVPEGYVVTNVYFKIQEVGGDPMDGDPMDRYPGTNEVTEVTVTLKKN